MKEKLFLFAVGLLCSCNAVKVNYDYDRAVDFSLPPLLQPPLPTIYRLLQPVPPPNDY